MEISLSHKFIYIHVSKTAGSNVARVLEPYAHHAEHHPWNRMLSRMGINVNYMGPLHWRRFRRHATALTARNHLPATFYQQAFKFAFVRNPWDWIVSLYHFLLRKTTHRHHARIKAMSGFEEYLRFEIHQNKRFQHPFITDRSGEIIVDFVGRFENLFEDFATVCHHLQVQKQEIPQITVSEKRDYRSFYTDETRELVARHFQRDIELFGYGFDPQPVEAIWVSRPPTPSLPSLISA